MRAVISTTFDDKYFFFLPITVWCWHKLNIGTICFMPFLKDSYGHYDPDKENRKKYSLIIDTLDELDIGLQAAPFLAPEHKEATYAQCLRNFGASIEGLDENELICSSDVDMICFKKPPYNDMLTIWGSDLVPQGQMPMCYINGTVKQWKEALNIGNKTYQECIDELLADDECEHYKGNRWSRDQEIAYNCISKVNNSLVPRAREGTQWAKNRLDRDDSYILDRLNPDNEDYHLNRPGYEDKNFEIILTILKYHYPDEDFTWLINYTNQYKALL